MKYIVLDGSLVLSQSAFLIPDIPAILNGEILTETLYANGSECYFFKEYYNKLLWSLNLLGMKIPCHFEEVKLNKLIKRLLNANKFLQGVQIKIILFRNADNSTSYALISDKTEDTEYNFNKRGLKVGIFTDMKKPLNLLSGIRNSNNYLYLKARIFASENNLDDCIIINEYDNTVETAYSDIFIVKDNHLFTPSIETGRCFEIFHDKIIELAEKIGFKVTCLTSIKYDNLIDADEIFLVNITYGIRWVVAFEESRYYCIVSKKMFENLHLILHS
jgi:branched-chain amino acid aminotransferase